MLTVVLGLGLGPERLHQLDVLTDYPSAVLEALPVVGELLAVPPESHPQGEPSAGHVVEGGDGLRQRDRIVLGNECDPDGDPQ